MLIQGWCARLIFSIIQCQNNTELPSQSTLTDLQIGHCPLSFLTTFQVKAQGGLGENHPATITEDRNDPTDGPEQSRAAPQLLENAA